MIGQRYQIARMQSDFYREKYYKLLRSLLVLITVMVLLIGVIIYLVLFKASPNFYAATTQGKIIPMIPIQSK